MKAIICGGRDYEFTEANYCALDKLCEELPVTEVVSGCAPGADACGEKWAVRRSISIKQFPADWAGQGRKAGPLRNQQMADYADVCIAFPGGKGTEDMVRKATKRGLRVFDLRLGSS